MKNKPTAEELAKQKADSHRMHCAFIVSSALIRFYLQRRQERNLAFLEMGALAGNPTTFIRWGNEAAYRQFIHDRVYSGVHKNRS